MGRRVMGDDVAVIKLDYVNSFVDKGNVLRHKVRRGGRSRYLHGVPGSEEFMAQYHDFLADAKPASPAPRTGEGSLGRLITEYYGSTAFRNLKPSSQKGYRYALEPLAKAHGHRLVRDMRADKVAKIIADIGAEHPGMANFTKSVLQMLMKYAVKAKWRPDNPVVGIDRFKSGTHHTWTEGELKTFETHWPLGTRERLAYALLLHTIQRVGDVAKMKRADITDGELHVIQDKTGAELYLPILPELAQAMKAYPARGLTLIGTEDGRPLTRPALSHVMRDAIKAAGLPAKCVSHGLRKSGMSRMAEAGFTEKQIAAWSGHKTLREIERYTKAADQKKLVRASVDKYPTKKRTGSD
jgi:enterobacteria phage integrase